MTTTARTRSGRAAGRKGRASTSAALTLLCFFGHAYAEAPVPSSLVSTWQVVQVRTDRGATRRLNYEYDDPRLKWRLFAITRDRITTDAAGDRACVAPSMSAVSTTAGALVRDTLSGRSAAQPPPTPADYELPLAADGSADVLWVSCGEGSFGPSRAASAETNTDRKRRAGTWILPLTQDEIAVRWYDQTVLTLRKLSSDAPPSPSFPCATARSSVEKAICGSVELAGFDRSLAEAYAAALDRKKRDNGREAVRRTRNAQAQWQVSRDRCGADAGCIRKSIETRLAELTTPER
jgi:uncharacterized protein YecT (DUF1311 family)